MLTKIQAGTYTEFITVFANVFLGMQLALSSYLQVCFSITNDVVMSISLMYEQPESGKSLIIFTSNNSKIYRRIFIRSHGS
jgi:sodium/potassium-transporting ATPase subunit alpha